MDDRDPTVYSATPKLFAPVAAGVALALAITLIALGHVVIGSALLGVAVLALLVLVQDVAARSSRIVTHGYGRARALSGFAGESMRTWSRTGGRVARLQLETRRLTRECRQVQFELGAAVYVGDEDEAEALLERLRILDEQLTGCIQATERAIEDARSKVARERLAVNSTQVRRAR